MKVSIKHADTCLTDYWGGHHLPHVGVPVYRGMHLDELKKDLAQEIIQEAVCGGDYHTLMEQYPNGEWDEAAKEAVQNLKAVTPDHLFGDLEESTHPEHQDYDENAPMVYAYFVFTLDED